MTRQQLLDKRDFFNLVHGITLRAIETFADNELDFRPRLGIRTPRELIFHIYGQEQALAEAARDGSFTMELANRSNPEDPSRTAAVSALATVADVVGYARACHDAAERIFRAMSEDDVVRPVNSPFGSYPAWQYLVFATTSIGIIAGSCTRICDCSGRSHRCSMTTRSPSDENLRRGSHVRARPKPPTL